MSAKTPEWVAQKRYVTVHGSRIAYVDMGQGDPIVFLHGNPTSSYLWRNIMPQLTGFGRCLAPDLIGMGNSEKLADSGPTRYTLAEHQRYVDGFITAVAGDRRVTLVIHDWGSALGFAWASRHPQQVAGICYMEGIVKPLTWAEWPESARAIFEAMRSPAGEALVLEKNIFVERILPKSIMRPLTEQEMDAYRAPFLRAGEDRRPVLSWPRQIPLEGEPPAVIETVEKYGRWLATCEVPKLFINAEPGMILVGAPRDFCRRWRNQQEVTVSGLHFIQEDSPDEIAAAIANWLRARTAASPDGSAT